MGSTEHFVALAPGHLAQCLALSASAYRNQNEADWRLMLGCGRGWGVEWEGRLAASTLVLPYGAFAWISMVLVLPEHRRKGYATRLLRHAMRQLEREGRVAVLDATPAGRTVYAQEGFQDRWGFRRFRLDAAGVRVDTSHAARALAPEDWPRVLELDRVVFGASREAVLRDLARRLPEAAWVLEESGRLRGFVLGRDGRESRQIGPLVMVDPGAAKVLLAAALSCVRGPVYLDLVDREVELARWVEGLGFKVQRPFTRMVRGSAEAPGDASRVVLVAGPELG